MDGKKAKTKDDAWEIQETFEGKPHGWVQWKGTDVCMDVNCKCGEHTHVDGWMAYHVKCLKCGTVYMCNGHIELIEIEVEPSNTITADANVDDDICQ